MVGLRHDRERAVLCGAVVVVCDHLRRRPSLPRWLSARGPGILPSPLWSARRSPPPEHRAMFTSPPPVVALPCPLVAG